MPVSNLRGRVARLERQRRERDAGRGVVLRVIDSRTGKVIYTVPPGHEHEPADIELPDNGRAEPRIIKTIAGIDPDRL